MAEKRRIVVGTFGQTIRARTWCDLTGNTGVFMRFRKPGGSSWTEKTAAVYGAEADGYVEYTTLSGDNLSDTAGALKVTVRSTWTGKSIISDPAAIVPIVEEGEN